MKMNPDCIRDILLYLEEHLSYVNEEDKSTKINEVSWNQIINDNIISSNYETKDIKYSIQKLAEVDYIRVSVSTSGNKGWFTCDISDITWKGHQFLNDIRPKTVWEATKKGASKLGLMSIQALTSISGMIIQGIISNPKVIDGIIKGMNI